MDSFKCPCGYEYEKGVDWDGDRQYKVLKGDEEFKLLRGHGLTFEPEPWCSPSEARLYVCPKCGTVKAA